MNDLAPTPDHSALRIGLALVGALAVLLIVIAIFRPEMMGMAMIHRLIVGFGL